MPSKKPQSLDELLGAFVGNVERTARLPNIYRYEPMPMQDLFHQSQTKGRILFGGNRAGKTFGGGADDVLMLTHRHPHRQHLYPEGPLRMRWIGVDFERGIDQAALPLFSQLVPPSMLIDSSWEKSYSQSRHLLTLADGATCSFMSYEQDADKFQAVSLHHVHMDEEPPKPIFQESMLRLLDTNGTWTISETPVQQLEWIQDELIEPAESGKRADIQVFYLDTMDNIHISTEAKLELFGLLNEEERIVRQLGKYPGGSLVFPEFDRKWPFVIERDMFQLTPEWRVYESMDHGYENPTAWLWTAVHPDGSIVTFESRYAAHIVVSEWAKIIHVVRNSICEKYGLRLEAYMEMLGGTFGDPAIADGGNSSAQTGITHQQVYSLGGIYIATDGIRQARAGKQNIGLDKIHSYLRKRPAAHPRGDLPWWQTTDNNTALIDEMKKARKPRQSLNNKEVRSGSEQIRDKDNHAIDAIKYLFMITHDLRPLNYREDDDRAFRELGARLNAAPLPSVTHADVYANVMSKEKTLWNVHGADSYFAMEE